MTILRKGGLSSVFVYIPHTAEDNDDSHKQIYTIIWKSEFCGNNLQGHDD